MSIFSKLMPRVTVLSLLVAGIVMYRPAPTQAQTCEGACMVNYNACVAGCGGNQTCNNSCLITERVCLTNCNGGPA